MLIRGLEAIFLFSFGYSYSGMSFYFSFLLTKSSFFIFLGVGKRGPVSRSRKLTANASVGVDGVLNQRNSLMRMMLRHHLMTLTKP